MFSNETREDELRTDDSSYSNGRGEINSFVAQLDVVAKIRNVISHERLQGLTLGANLKRTFRIGSHRHIEMRHGEKGVCRAAGTKFHQGIRLHAAGGFVNLAKEIGQRLDRIFRADVMMRRIETRWNGIHMLAVKLEAVESPVSQNLTHQRFVVLHDSSVGRT